jgi:hypothetical protein
MLVYPLSRTEEKTVHLTAASLALLAVTALLLLTAMSLA